MALHTSLCQQPSKDSSQTRPRWTGFLSAGSGSTQPGSPYCASQEMSHNSDHTTVHRSWVPGKVSVVASTASFIHSSLLLLEGPIAMAGGSSHWCPWRFWVCTFFHKGIVKVGSKRKILQEDGSEPGLCVSLEHKSQIVELRISLQRDRLSPGLQIYFPTFTSMIPLSRDQTLL